MLEVKPLRPDQWPLLKTVRLRALADAPEAFCTSLAEASARTDAQWQENARRFTLLPPAVSCFAFLDGVPCGMANCFVTEEDPQTAELTAFWVASESRSQGVGEALVASVTAWAALQSVTTLQVWVVEDNYRALAFYRRVGFSETGRRLPHEPDPTKQVVMLTYQISA